ncbi:MAG: MazG nucleotide pyrophosphohydrolase domain-containing protein [Candidatus Heimdallarchaeaceae archaeon]
MLKDLQKQIDSVVSKEGYWSPLEITARMAEEVGEVARETNIIHGKKKRKKRDLGNCLGEELADVIFTVVCYANSYNINLDDEIKKVLNKYKKRRDEKY